MNDVEEKQTANRQRLMDERAAETSACQFDDVVRERTRQVGARADVSNYLEPRSNESESKAAQRTRNVQVLAARLAPQRCRDKRRVWN